MREPKGHGDGLLTRRPGGAPCHDRRLRTSCFAFLLCVVRAERESGALGGNCRRRRRPGFTAWCRELLHARQGAAVERAQAFRAVSRDSAGRPKTRMSSIKVLARRTALPPRPDMSDASHNIPYDIEAPVPILFFDQSEIKPRLCKVPGRFFRPRCGRFFGGREPFCEGDTARFAQPSLPEPSCAGQSDLAS